MIYSDSHMHCNYSTDSSAKPEEMIKASIEKGLTSICFTDHIDYDFPLENLKFEFDMDDYFSCINGLKERYKDQIEIRIGVELGLQPHLNSRYQKLIDSYDFDFVIGSSHVVDDMDPYYPEYFENRDEKEAYRRYFEYVLENVNAFTGYDVYGHLDYIFRYGPSGNSIYSCKDFQDIVDEILKKLIAAGKGIEVNAAGYKRGLNSPNPDIDTIKRYLSFGGEILTIGADAHMPQHVGKNFDKIFDILNQCGVKQYTIFKNRKPEFVNI